MFCLSSKSRAGRRDELPHAGGSRDRHRLRVVGALDEGQQRQLGRHAALVELLDDVEQVAAAALGHARHVVGPGRVPALAVADEVVVEIGHREAAADALPEVDAGGALVEVEPDFGAERIDRHRVDRGRRIGRRRRDRACGGGAAAGGRRSGRRRRCRRPACTRREGRQRARRFAPSGRDRVGSSAEAFFQVRGEPGIAAAAHRPAARTADVSDVTVVRTRYRSRSGPDRDAAARGRREGASLESPPFEAPGIERRGDRPRLAGSTIARAPSSRHPRSSCRRTRAGRSGS